MTILLIGNSLTAGNLGIPYSRYLKTTGEIINHGLDGDTLRGVQIRLNELLTGKIPDILVVQTGANDILLPEMASRGGEWTAFVEDMEKRGSIPTTHPAEFTKIYTRLISSASAAGMSNQKIICATIPPIGEKLNSKRNQIRRDYNRGIRKAVERTGAVLADVALAFEKELQKYEFLSDWFFNSPGDFTTDVKEVRRGIGARSLSEKRGLYLTMDGAHLNEKGAELMGAVLSSAIAMEAVPRSVL